MLNSFTICPAKSQIIFRISCGVTFMFSCALIQASHFGFHPCEMNGRVFTF
jgi:hypothetical protein